MGNAAGPASRTNILKPTRSTLVLLRFPFFFFLAPVFLSALAISPGVNPAKAVAAFLIIHFLLYPASNGFNSYYDRDEGSIGGISKPPLVTPDLLWVALALDALALALGFLVSAWFVLYLFLYGLGSKAYSWDRIRLKRFPVWSWLSVGIGQGAATFIASYGAINNLPLRDLLDSRLLIPAGLIGVILLGVYPLTQVYQHEEDRSQGVTSFSMLVGIRGTFLVSGSCLAAGGIGFALYFSGLFSVLVGIVFLGFMAPVLAFFMLWLVRVFADPAAADWKNAMRMNLAASACMNLCFILMFVAARAGILTRS
jgi:4-hydroxybenzoate polyprenyltransferase